MQHAKLLALEKEFFPIRPFNCDCKCSYLSEDIMNLAMLIFDFPNVLLNFASDQEPYILVDFLFNLARTAAKLMLQYSQKFGGNNTDEKRDVCELFFYARITLENGLWILGAPPSHHFSSFVKVK